MQIKQLPCMKVKGKSYFVDVETKRLIRTNDPDKVIEFKDLSEDTRKLIRIFYENKGER